MLLMIPDPNAAAAAVASLAEPGLQGLAVVAFAALTTAMQPITWAGDFDIAVPINGAMAMIIFIASATSISYGAAAASLPRPPRIGAAGYFLRFLAILYALVVIPLGIQDMGSANMFSSLRMHGGRCGTFLVAPCDVHVLVHANVEASTDAHCRDVPLAP